MRKKSLVCIFAHPDDEAFGPSGTIHKLAKEFDVYILCATKGQAGKDSGEEETKLEKRRADELKKSAEILGVKRVHFLGFRDGTLCNNLYHKIAAKVEVYLEKYKPETLLTYGPTGVSGHIDHITMSMVTSYVFQKHTFIKKIMQYVISKERAEVMGKDYFIYFPPGVPRSKIDLTINVDDIWDIKLLAMKQHESQKHDYERVLNRSEGLPKEETFIIVKK